MVSAKAVPLNVTVETSPRIAPKRRQAPNVSETVFTVQCPCLTAKSAVFILNRLNPPQLGETRNENQQLTYVNVGMVLS
jgi:hypothetical protein